MSIQFSVLFSLFSQLNEIFIFAISIFFSHSFVRSISFALFLSLARFLSVDTCVCVCAYVFSPFDAFSANTLTISIKTTTHCTHTRYIVMYQYIYVVWLTLYSPCFQYLVQAATVKFKAYCSLLHSSYKFVCGCSSFLFSLVFLLGMQGAFNRSANLNSF